MRSLTNHRHFMAIIGRALERMPTYRNKEELLAAIKLAASHTQVVQRLDGTLVEVPSSISFNALDEAEFSRFKARAVYLLARKIGCDPAELEVTNQGTEPEFGADQSG